MFRDLLIQIKMKDATVVALLLLSIVLPVGCSTAVSRAKSKPTVALAMRNTGSVRPTDQQLASAYRVLQEHLTAAGYRFAETPATAQFIVNAEFVASPVNPAGGHVRIVGLEPSTALRKAVAGDTDSEDIKNLRERLRDIERWIEMQSRPRIGDGGI